MRYLIIIFILEIKIVSVFSPNIPNVNFFIPNTNTGNTTIGLCSGNKGEK